jgi:hypothetical protein
MSMYSRPEKFGLTTIGEIDWEVESYSYDLTVVWIRNSDGRLLYADDYGCSCPTPFEDIGIDDLVLLQEVGGLEAFKTHCKTHRSRNPNSAMEMVALLEKMYQAGLR